MSFQLWTHKPFVKCVPECVIDVFFILRHTCTCNRGPFTTVDELKQHQIRAWLSNWGRVTHICVGNLTIIGSDNGLSPGRRQAIIWTNDGILLIGPLGTNFSEHLNRNSNLFIQEKTFESVVCEMATILSWPQWVKSFTSMEKCVV